MFIQMIFFCLLIVALFAGAISYFPQLQKPIHPLQFAMNSIGYTGQETSNEKRSQQFNVAVSGGLRQIHRQMDNISVEQNRLLDALQDQQQILKNVDSDIHSVLLEAQNQGNSNDKDILQLKALASQMQDEDRLLVANGQNLIALNDQLSQNRQLLAEEANLVDMNNQSSLDDLKRGYASFENQASGLFNKVGEYNSQVRNETNEMQGQLYSLDNNVSFGGYAQQQSMQIRMESMLQREQDDLMKLADSQQKSRDLMQDAQEKMADSLEKIEQKEERNQEAMDQERQKQQDQEAMIQQRIADQEQKLQDQQNR